MCKGAHRGRPSCAAVAHSTPRSSTSKTRNRRALCWYVKAMLLADRRLLVTGVLTEGSIAFSVARRAQEEGAEVVLTGFGRGLRITERIARRLPTEADVLELDVNDPDQLAAVAGALDERWGALDGVLHAIAYVPPDALGGRFL